MIKLSSEVDIEKEKGVFVLAHVMSDEQVLLKTYAFKSEDVKTDVAIYGEGDNETLVVKNDEYQNVHLHIVKTLGATDPTLNEMLGNSIIRLYLLAERINMEINEQFKRKNRKPVTTLGRR